MSTYTSSFSQIVFAFWASWRAFFDFAISLLILSSTPRFSPSFVTLSASSHRALMPVRSSSMPASLTYNPPTPLSPFCAPDWLPSLNYLASTVSNSWRSSECSVCLVDRTVSSSALYVSIVDFNLAIRVSISAKFNVSGALRAASSVSLMLMVSFLTWPALWLSPSNSVKIC